MVRQPVHSLKKTSDLGGEKHVICAAFNLRKNMNKLEA